MVRRIEPPYCFEGEGDALFMGRELYTGYHFRSDAEAHDRVAAHLKTPYFALELCDKRFYHLDTCFAALSERSALVHLEAFEPYAQMVLLETVEDPIRVPLKEALRFACNAVVVGKQVIIPEGCPVTSKELRARGFTPHPLDFSEFIKAGGAAKCLVLRLA
jgi:N-dimethylarginine dimethylaminohydrolase